MRTLYLIRHAKSDQGIEHLSDIDRPLNIRGYESAHKMSSIMKEKNIVPDLIITSPAVRAISTALIFCRTLGIDPSMLAIHKDLYDTSVKEYHHCIKNIDDKYKCVMLFGHNPLITACANSLTTPFTEHMSTCSIVGVKGDISWANFTENANELELYDFPKNHHS